MKPKYFFAISGAVYGLICILHLLRMVFNWDFVFGSVTFPIWASCFPAVFFGMLAGFAIRLSSAKEGVR